MKIFFTILTLLGFWYLSTLQLANTATIEQVKDTPTSTSITTVTTTFIAWWPLYALIVVYLIWRKDIAKLINKNYEN
jgi:hypothetical protein